MKKLILSIIVLGITVNTYAQQKPQYTQYVLNNYIINPAITGIENYTDVKLGHRHQWVGLADAPVTTYFTAHKALGKQDDRLTSTSFAKTGENIRGNDYANDYEASAPHHGIGIQVVNDRTGPLQNLTAKATYAYHLGISRKWNLSGGVGVGINNVSLNTSKLFFGTDFPVDPAVFESGVLNKAGLDVDAGLWLYSDKVYVGAAALQIVPQKVDYSNNIVKITEGKKVPHLFLTAGYRYQVNEDVSITPSTMVKLVGPNPIQIDANVKAQYRDLAWAGANYRIGYGFSGYAGFNAYNVVNISYAYDYSFTKLNTVSRGTHEVILGFTIGNKYSMNTCPTRMW